MEKIRIKRDGKPAISFVGEVLSEEGGYVAGGREQNRWHNLALYRTESGNYVAAIEYHTQWQGEIEHSIAEQVSAEEIEDFFRAYDPTQFVQGFPAGPAYADRQANLMSWIRQRYDAQVSSVLDGCPEIDEKIK